jgi:uncharacterized membrane protein
MFVDLRGFTTLASQLPPRELIDILRKYQAIAVPIIHRHHGSITTYLGDGIMVTFFVLKSDDGVIRSAIDACDVCYRAGKGYEQSGDEMVCQNCGMRFPSAKINEVKGGCNPAPLTRVIEGDKLVIAMADIDQNSWYCKFKK